MGASISRTFSNSVNGTVSYAYNSISSSLGFDVTKSRTVETSYQITLNKGQKGEIKVRGVYAEYTVYLQRLYDGTLGCQRWINEPKSATAYNYLHPDYFARVY